MLVPGPRQKRNPSQTLAQSQVQKKGAPPVHIPLLNYGFGKKLDTKETMDSLCMSIETAPCYEHNVNYKVVSTIT
jgi:hypothetical protein